MSDLASAARAIQNHAWLCRFRKGLGTEMSPDAAKQIADYVDGFIDAVLAETTLQITAIPPSWANTAGEPTYSYGGFVIQPGETHQSSDGRTISVGALPTDEPPFPTEQLATMGASIPPSWANATADIPAQLAKMKADMEKSTGALLPNLLVS